MTVSKRGPKSPIYVQLPENTCVQLARQGARYSTLQVLPPRSIHTVNWRAGRISFNPSPTHSYKE